MNCQARAAGACKPSARCRAGWPGPRSQCAATAWLALSLFGEFINASRLRATESSDCWLRLARRSMACRVWSRVVLSSASNTADASISCISTLVRAMMSGQSASLIARKEVMALRMLRLSAAWSAPCCNCAAARSGRVRCSQSWIAWCSSLGPAGRRSLRRCASCARNTRPTPRPSSRLSNWSNESGVKLSILSKHRLAASSAALLVATRSARRRKLSTRTTRKVVGSAHISLKLRSRVSW